MKRLEDFLVTGLINEGIEDGVGDEKRNTPNAPAPSIPPGSCGPDQNVNLQQQQQPVKGSNPQNQYQSGVLLKTIKSSEFEQPPVSGEAGYGGFQNLDALGRRQYISDVKSSFDGKNATPEQKRNQIKLLRALETYHTRKSQSERGQEMRSKAMAAGFSDQGGVSAERQYGDTQRAKKIASELVRLSRMKPEEMTARDAATLHVLKLQLPETEFMDVQDLPIHGAAGKMSQYVVGELEKMDFDTPEEETGMMPPWKRTKVAQKQKERELAQRVPTGVLDTEVDPTADIVTQTQKDIEAAEAAKAAGVVASKDEKIRNLLYKTVGQPLEQIVSRSKELIAKEQEEKNADRRISPMYKTKFGEFKRATGRDWYESGGANTENMMTLRNMETDLSGRLRGIERDWLDRMSDDAQVAAAMAGFKAGKPIPLIIRDTEEARRKAERENPVHAWQPSDFDVPPHSQRRKGFDDPNVRTMPTLPIDTHTETPSIWDYYRKIGSQSTQKSNIRGKVNLSSRTPSSAADYMNKFRKA